MNEAPLVHIVGSNVLQNTLLSAYLQDCAGARCVWQLRIEDLQAEAANDLQLILLDCFPLGSNDIVTLLQSKAVTTVAGKKAVALFNLPAEAGVELPALRYGIRGFFYQQDPPESLAKGVQALMRQEYWVSRKLLVQFLSTPNQVPKIPTHFPGLTSRESQLLALLVQGCSNQSISDQLFISIPTVKSHLSSIYRKISVTTRLQAVCWAERHTSLV